MYSETVLVSVAVPSFPNSENCPEPAVDVFTGLAFSDFSTALEVTEVGVSFVSAEKVFKKLSVSLLNSKS